VKPEAFVQKTGQPNLEVITCGPIPPNPSELLGSKRMLALLDSLRQDYERIILDSPPILAATDAAVLTSIVDGTVLVVKAGGTNRQTAQRAVKMLKDLNARIVGVVLNGIMVGKNGYYYYDYYYHYGHYYGEEDNKEKSSWFKKRTHKKSVEKHKTPM
jgi:capsular exopolysaccharide synthesis family protein